MKKGSEIEYFFYSRTFCKVCKEEFSTKAHKSILQDHIKKYHDDEMDFGDHVKAHKDGKCDCGGVELSR